MKIERYFCEDIEYFLSLFVDCDVIRNRKGNPGRKKKRRPLLNIVSAFDIETTAISEIKQSFMYIWQYSFYFDKKDSIVTIYGRTWKQYQTFIRKLVNYLDINCLITYVHFLSHEWQYLKGIYKFTNDEIFATNAHNILKCSMFDEHIEYRCSYNLTKKSLRKFLKDMRVEIQKGEMDYTIKRYSNTKLSENDFNYACQDTEGLCLAIYRYMQSTGDNLQTIPLTSTGFVRRDLKHSMMYSGGKEILLDSLQLYDLARKCFRGGNTHANRFYTNMTLSNVKSRDKVSSYPHVILSYKYPGRPFVFLKNAEYTEDFINRGYAVMFTAKYTNLRLKKFEEPVPYLSCHKGEFINEVKDNGRVMYADVAEISMTDVDYRIFKQQYSYDDVKYIRCAYSLYANPPREWINLVLDYYKRKTKLKGVEGNELEYMLVKNKFNALYGMVVEKTLRKHLFFNGVEFEESDNIDLESDYYENKKRGVLDYVLGVWVTAYARKELQEMINYVGMNGGHVIYVDTDSVKYVESIEREIDWKKFNERIIEKDISIGAVAENRKGVKYYIGIAESDGIYSKFKTMGAKKYVYTIERQFSGKVRKSNKFKVVDFKICKKYDNVRIVLRGNADKRLYYLSCLYITIAGVVKNSGAAELNKLGGINAFRPGTIFTTSAGNKFNYNDIVKGFWYNDNGHNVFITSNLYSEATTYELGQSDDYIRLLAIIDNLRYSHKRIGGDDFDCVIFDKDSLLNELNKIKEKEN